MAQEIRQRSRLAKVQRAFKQDFIDVLRRQAITPARNVLLSAADADGNVLAERRVKSQIRQIIKRLFVADDEQPYGDDGITPMAPYPRLLNEHYVIAVREAIRPQHDWLNRNIPEDVFDFLARGSADTGIQQIRQADPLPPPVPPFPKWVRDLRIFEPNPAAEIDVNRQWVPMHKWQDERGYRLSDRIWRTSQDVRDKIDRLLIVGLADGNSALNIAQALEFYLIPEEAGRRTLKPYGRQFMSENGAAFSAMRLARTELARAFNAASFTASYLNPYVDKIDVARSSNGDPTCTICPQHATIGIGGDRIREPYSIHAANYGPFHPHCMCHNRPVVTDSPAEVTRRLRRIMEEPTTDLRAAVGPANQQAFLQELIGSGLVRLLPQLVMGL